MGNAGKFPVIRPSLPFIVGLEAALPSMEKTWLVKKHPQHHGKLHENYIGPGPRA